MTIGGNNPLAFQVGGSPTRFERTLAALKNAVGKGGAAQSDTGIEAYWRRAKALGLTAVIMDGKAALQAFPNLATDLISMYEEILGTFPAPGQDDESRRLAATELWTRQASGVGPRLSERLEAMDPRFSIIDPPHGRVTTTQHGRTIEPMDGSEPTNIIGQIATGIPNFSHDFMFHLRLDLGLGVAPTQSELKTLDTAKNLLQSDLPAWVDFAISADDEFQIDVSLLDYGCPA